MTMQEQVRQDLKDAMKSGDSVRRDVLRMLESSAKNVAIDKKLERDVLDDSVVIEAVRRAVKQRKDSIEQFEQGGRADLAESEKAELAILSEYLPSTLSEEAVRELLQPVFTELGSANAADFGKVMGKAMQVLSGKAEGDVVKKVVQEFLNS